MVKCLLRVSASDAASRRHIPTGFQVALERDRAWFVTKNDQDVQLPRRVPRRMYAFTGVVRDQTFVNI
jgi:hypothetical protein